MPPPAAAPPPLPPDPTPGRPPPGFWIRAGAAVVDLAILAIASRILALVLGVPLWLLLSAVPARLLAPLALLVQAATLALPLLYFAVTESGRRQATPGKRLFALAVTDAAGERLTFARALARTGAKLLSALPLGLGFLGAAVGARRRALHDVLSDTRVVRRRLPGPAAPVAVVVAAAAAAALVGPRVARVWTLRTRAEEPMRELAALHAAQRAYLRRHGEYAPFSSCAYPGREGQRSGAARLEQARAIGWDLPEHTYSSYCAVVDRTPEGIPSYSACALADLDGNKGVAAVALWQPPVDAEGRVVGLPPPAPCSGGRLARPREIQAGDPIGVPVRLSPPDVY